MALATPVQAQPSGSVEDFQLPAGEASGPSSPPAAGPIDPEKPAPIQNPSPAAPQPVPVPPLITEHAPSPPAILSTPVETPAVGIPPSPRGADAPDRPAESTIGRVPAPTASGSAPEKMIRVPSSSPAAGADKTSPALTPSVPPTKSGNWAWWFGGGALLVFLLAGIIWRLQRKPAHEDFASATVVDGAALPLATEETPAFTPPADTTAPSVARSQIELEFEPQSLTLALINARLSYRLSVKNMADAPVGPVGIACDIISAHASLSAEEQLLFKERGDIAELKHQLRSVEPGETISFTSELQLPVSDILPIRSGRASLFVPLVRFRIDAPDAEGRPRVATRVFVIGESPEQPGKRLKPIRMDLGLRTVSRISQREVETSV